MPVQECGKCTSSIRLNKDSVVICGGGCGHLFHAKCYDLTEYDVNKVLCKPNVAFICDVCKGFNAMMNERFKKILDEIEINKCCVKKQSDQIDNIMKSVHSLKSDKKSMISEIKQVCANSSKEPCATNTRESYADQLKKAPIVIKPKGVQESAATKSEIKSKIDPTTLSLKINGVYNRPGGSIAISCDEESKRKIEKVVNEELKGKYNVRVPEMRNPCVIVYGISEEWEKEKFCNAIKRQNDIEGEIKCIKFNSDLKNRNKYFAIIQMKCDDYRKIIAASKLNIGWDRCYVSNYVEVERCYCCWGYNHKAKNCRNGIICAKCGDKHETRSCINNELKCNNCVVANEKLGLELDIKHDCRDKCCAVFQKHIKVNKSNTNY